MLFRTRIEIERLILLVRNCLRLVMFVHVTHLCDNLSEFFFNYNFSLITNSSPGV